MTRSASLVIDTAVAAPHRRRVGPTAWIVLEALAMRATDDPATVITNVRELGVELGLSKDTVARALHTLADTGLVDRLDVRDDRTGRFVRSLYTIDLTRAGVHPADAAPPSSATRLTTRPAPLAPASTDAQLSLLADP